MCGIVAYIGTKQAYPILINGLHRLEYRGYDSAGVALLEANVLNAHKAKGKVSDFDTVGSSIACDTDTYIHFGTEIGIAFIKAFTG